MATEWYLRLKPLRWILLALLIQVQSVRAISTPSPSSTCTDLHPDAFGNHTLKPGVCYAVVTKSKMFPDAGPLCQKLGPGLGWDIADIEDETELGIVHDGITALVAAGIFTEPDKFWVGQNDRETEGVWRYLNDTSNKCGRAVYLNWIAGRPKFPGRRYNCVTYVYGEHGLRDVQCDLTLRSLCKVKLTSDTVPHCPGFVEPSIPTSAPPIDDCTDILPGAFGNPDEPGACYASDSAQTRTFVEAQSFCQSLAGGNWSVADVEGVDESLFLEVWNRMNFIRNNGYWIGQNDREREGDFRYGVSRRCPVWLNWHKKDPDGHREANCLIMYKKNSGQFMDKQCNGTDRYYTLCKLRTDSTPIEGLPPSCNEKIHPIETTVCSRMRSDAFGRVDRPGLCYFVTERELDWQSAIDFCKSEGWSLIEIEDLAENNFLVNRFTNFAPSGRSYWLGQNDREVESTWRYASGYKPPGGAVYLKWSGKEPNGGAAQGCVVMKKRGVWSDELCTSTYFVTCKKYVDNCMKDTCSGLSASSTTKPGHFELVASDATCGPKDALYFGYSAKTSVQCARDCLSRLGCQGFGFVAAGKDDDCVLCSRSLSAEDVHAKAGSRYYNRA